MFTLEEIEEIKIHMKLLLCFHIRGKDWSLKIVFTLEENWSTCLINKRK